MSQVPRASASQAAGTPASIPLDVTKAPICYVNFCRVTGTPEEMVIDLGLQTVETAAGPALETRQRVALNFYTAKRLLDALQATLQHHEANFGAIETNVEKRIVRPPQ